MDDNEACMPCTNKMFEMVIEGLEFDDLGFANSSPGVLNC